jgi:2,4-diketo-3-deoxy-L-fuconate hydrolase
MGTKVVKILDISGKSQWCVWEKNELFPLRQQPRNHQELLSDFGPDKLTYLASAPIAPETARFLSPLDPPCQIICQGKNYLDHLLETGTKPANKDYNLLFTKAASSLASPRGELRRPKGVKLLDYEIELGLVLKREINGPQNISASDVATYVGALIMANDVSARDVQVPQRQWFKGKSFRGFCPVGPVLYLLGDDDKNIFSDLLLQLKVNGQVRQQASTKQMMYEPADTLSEISTIFDLTVGDLILTGTPGGVAMNIKPGNTWQRLREKFLSDKEKMDLFLASQMQSSRYLNNGDTIESSIRSSDGSVDLGTQRLLVTD